MASHTRLLHLVKRPYVKMIKSYLLTIYSNHCGSGRQGTTGIYWCRRMQDFSELPGDQLPAGASFDGLSSFGTKPWNRNKLSCKY